jgi:MarR family 2-MHQ and catechol resistance regulon transcriptional repressor
MGTHYRGRREEVRALDAYIKLMRAANSVQGRLDRHLGRHRLRENQLGVLEVLLHLGPLTQMEVGRKLFTSGANVTTIVDNLEKRGLVTRVRGQEDRRQVTLHLTREGRALIERVFPLHLREIGAGFRALGAKEQADLSRLCKTLGTAQADIPIDESD